MPAQPRKRPRVDKAAAEEKSRVEQAALDGCPSLLLSDHRTAWLVSSSEDHTVELMAKDEPLTVHKAVLTKSSEYFQSAFKKPFTESRGTVSFTDIEPKYLALFVGVAYQHAALVPATPPSQATAPQTKLIQSNIRDFVEVYKLCDRFICHDMALYIDKCLDVAMLDGHRAMYLDTGEPIHQQMMRNFADGYEALELVHSEQARIGDRLLTLFCGAIKFSTWAESVDQITDRPRFVAEVSKRFATKLNELARVKKFSRKEIRS